MIRLRAPRPSANAHYCKHSAEAARCRLEHTPPATRATCIWWPASPARMVRWLSPRKGAERIQCNWVQPLEKNYYSGEPMKSCGRFIRQATLCRNSRETVLTTRYSVPGTQYSKAGADSLLVHIIAMVSKGKYKNQSQPRLVQGTRAPATRTRKQPGTLSTMLRQQGATVLEIPTIEIRPPRSWSQLDEALRRHDDFDGLILTRVNDIE